MEHFNNIEKAIATLAECAGHEHMAVIAKVHQEIEAVLEKHRCHVDFDRSMEDAIASSVDNSRALAAAIKDLHEALQDEVDADPSLMCETPLVMAPRNGTTTRVHFEAELQALAARASQSQDDYNDVMREIASRYAHATNDLARARAELHNAEAAANKKCL